MSNPYIQTTDAQLGEMLARAGAASVDELFADQVPAGMEYRGELALLNFFLIKGKTRQKTVTKINTGMKSTVNPLPK